MEKIDYFPILSAPGNGNSPVPNIAGMKLAERIYFIASATPTTNEKASALYKQLLRSTRQ